MIHKGYNNHSMMAPSFLHYTDAFRFVESNDYVFGPMNQTNATDSAYICSKVCIDMARSIVRQAVWLGATFISAKWQGEFLETDTIYSAIMTTSGHDVHLGALTMEHGRVHWL